MNVKFKVLKRDLQTIYAMANCFRLIVKREQLQRVIIYKPLPTGIDRAAVENNIAKVILTVTAASVRANYKTSKTPVQFSININAARDLFNLNNMVETNTPEQYLFTQIINEAVKTFL